MSTPMIRLMCPNLKCRRILAVPSTARGKNVRCRGCGAHIRIPDPNQPQTTAPEAEPSQIE